MTCPGSAAARRRPGRHGEPDRVDWREISARAVLRDGKGRESGAVISVGEEQILRQIEDGLRADDRGFSRQFTLRMDALRCNSPRRRKAALALADAALLVFTVLTAAAASAWTRMTAARIARRSAAAVLEAICKRPGCAGTARRAPRTDSVGET